MAAACKNIDLSPVDFSVFYQISGMETVTQGLM